MMDYGYKLASICMIWTARKTKHVCEAVKQHSKIHMKVAYHYKSNTETLPPTSASNSTKEVPSPSTRTLCPTCLPSNLVLIDGSPKSDRKRIDTLPAATSNKRGKDCPLFVSCSKSGSAAVQTESPSSSGN